MSSAPCRSSRPHRRTRSWSRTSRYLEAATRDGGPNVVFARTSGDPVAVARRVAAATKADGTVVRNIREQTQQTVSSITTVDLTGIAKIESVFAVILAAAAMWLFVGLSLAERRQEFATMAALGASLRQISAYLWSEAAIVLGAALVLAAGLGWLLAKMLVAMLHTSSTPRPTRSQSPGRSSPCSPRQQSAPRPRRAHWPCEGSGDCRSARS